MPKEAAKGRRSLCQPCKDAQLQYDVITGIYMLDPLEAFAVSELSSQRVLRFRHAGRRAGVSVG
jgi:hypothetical protein